MYDPSVWDKNISVRAKNLCFGFYFRQICATILAKGGTLPHDHGQPPEPTLAAMPDTESFQTIAELLKQLGDSSRIRIFWLLCHCEECVINLSAMMKMSSPAISHHLKQLKSSGLIVSRRSGKEVYYRAADTQQAQLLHRMIETLLQINCPNPTIGR